MPAVPAGPDGIPEAAWAVDMRQSARSGDGVGIAPATGLAVEAPDTAGGRRARPATVALVGRHRAVPGESGPRMSSHEGRWR